MKYLKLFENFNKSIRYELLKLLEIDDICEKYNIKKYTVNPNGSVDVNGDVYLYNKYLTELPLKFNKVTGSFDCRFNDLTNLEGCPNYVGWDFQCSYNKLTSLEDSPSYINRDFWFDNNALTTLEGYPKEIGGRDFRYSGNPIAPIINLFKFDLKIYLEYQETYNFLRKDCKIVKHRLIEALNDFNEYYNKQVELPEKIEGYTYI